jgi:apolipoprotein N-acyltransferase
MTDAATGGAALPGAVDRVAQFLGAQPGWRRYGLAFLLGTVTTLSLPPVYLFPLNFVTFPALIWLLSGAGTRRAAFFTGWWFGFGFFAVGLYWIANALLVFAAQYAWMLPFVSLGLPAFLAVYAGLPALAAHYGRDPLERSILFALAWCCCEWIRGHFLTGLPWNLIGYSWAGSDAMLQVASLCGIYGVSVLAVLSACLPGALAGTTATRRWLALGVAIAIPAAGWAYGTFRLPEGADPLTETGVRIVQSDILQSEKWARQHQQRNLQQFLDQSRRDRPDWVSTIIWPETAATFFLGPAPELRRLLATVVPPGGLLLTGAPRREENPYRLMNSMIALNERGVIVGHYDKFHLVPFGEYVPLAKYLPIDKLTQGGTGYTPGPGPRTLHLPRLPPVGPLICYEVIFPGRVVASQERPQWLLNLTNDAWYGRSAGPHQHLAQSRVRATEEGLPMVRAAYDGMSAVIDPYGRVLKRLGLEVAGTIDARLPAALPTPPPYARLGSTPYVALLFAILAIYVTLRFRKL